MKEQTNIPDLYDFLLREFRMENYYGKSDYGLKKDNSTAVMATRERNKLRELDVDNETLLKVLEECQQLASEPFSQLHIITEKDTGYKHFGFQFKEPKQKNEEFILLLRAFCKHTARLQRLRKI